MSMENLDALQRALTHTQLQASLGNPIARLSALGALKELESPTSREPRHQAFLDLCRHVGEGYRGLSDDQIVAADETPRLMRYLISALDSYAARSSPEGDRASDRYKRLAEAFGAAGDHGGNHRSSWPEARERGVLAMYSNTLNGRADPETLAARLHAFDAAYDMAFGPDSEGGREEREQKKNREQLMRLLLKHGYLWPGAFDQEDVRLRGQGESS